METHFDPVDGALKSLAGREWPDAGANPELENRLMQSYQKQPPASAWARHRILVSAAVILLLAGASFAAAGGVDLVRGWFMTIEVNGNVVHSGEVTFDENGEAKLLLPPDALQCDGEGNITVNLEAGGDASDGPGMKTIVVTGGDNEVIVRVGSQPDETGGDTAQDGDVEEQPSQGGE